MTARSYALGGLSMAALSILIARSLGPQSDGPMRLLVQAQAAQRNVARIGINLGTWTSWGAEQLSSNVLMNPGFETTIDRAIVIVSHADGGGFEDDQSWLARPDGFWRGAHFDVRSGAEPAAAACSPIPKAPGPIACRCTRRTRRHRIWPWATWWQLRGRMSRDRPRIGGSRAPPPRRSLWIPASTVRPAPVLARSA